MSNKNFSFVKLIALYLFLFAVCLGSVLAYRYTVKKNLEQAARAIRNELMLRIRDLASSPLTVQSNAGLNPDFNNRYNPELRACLTGRCTPDAIGKPQPMAFQNRAGTIIVSATALKPGSGTAVHKNHEVSSAPVGNWLYYGSSGVPCGLPVNLNGFPRCPYMLQTYFIYDCEKKDCSDPENVWIEFHFYVRFNRESKAIPHGTWPMIPFQHLGTYQIPGEPEAEVVPPIRIHAATALRGY